ncbi:hypothetical protein A1O3_02404 [Capronia epimyces CBS 606.96]|uniref:BRCT domain-containing protein n=1 Tax=Capronia epimyces CBS 606.96 TaxID=1182542 RepID=W9Y945_9EURO|nr:uncharacterized protein A1O3_02404 [Capronia epimyces CBS 606.96]EXJ89337.1 hypothetical protein A1O3_02404 [Capronia epimyces CBS 606.96]
MFILPTHLKPEELHEIEDQVFGLEGPLTYDPKEAKIFLGRITQKKRAAFDLRARGIWTVEAPMPSLGPSPSHGHGSHGREQEQEQEHDQARDEGPARKRLKVGHGDRNRDRRAKLEADSTCGRRSRSSPSPSPSPSPGGANSALPSLTPAPESLWHGLTDHVLVLKLSWLETCLKQQRLAAYEPYIIYAAKVIPPPAGEDTPQPLQDPITYIRATPGTGSSASLAQRKPKPTVTTSILDRAKAEASSLSLPAGSYPGRRRYGDHNRESGSPTIRKAAPPKLLRTTTSEFEDLAAHPLPPLPEWAQGPHAAYSCCRSTPMASPNSAFIAQLAKIRDGRILTLDDIGVRAYSTSIASIAAYPPAIRHPEEINRLPGCNEKIAMLWSEWFHSADEESDRSIQAVQDLDNDVDLQHLRLFWNIWGVGPETARKFYFEHGWQDLDDVVEFGWSTLTRVQQIGVKYYDEFQDKIPRAEVEQIGAVIHHHARSVLKIQPAQYGSVEDVECIIVGGYRRGKQASGDVDVVLSHRDETKTHHLVGHIVRSLELEGWITHTLTLHTTTSDRAQATLPFRAERRGHGFDSLDKALCVWQNPHFDTAPAGADVDGFLAVEERGRGGGGGAGGGGGDGKEEAEPTPKDQPARNPNIHRRVDIIISSWRTVGCAVLGWSGGTTFQRDLRRFVAKTRGWKFDSSGVRDRGNGMVLDLESPTRRSDANVNENANTNANAYAHANVVSNDHDHDRDRDRFSFSDSMLQAQAEAEAQLDSRLDDADTWHDRERRLMDSLGIGYRPPGERCTG